MCLLQSTYSTAALLNGDMSGFCDVNETIFGSHPITPNGIECRANDDLKRAPPRIQVLLGER